MLLLRAAYCLPASKLLGAGATSSSTTDLSEALHGAEVGAAPALEGPTACGAGLDAVRSLESSAGEGAPYAL